MNPTSDFIRWKRENGRYYKVLHNEELHNLYSSPSIIIKSRRMRWAGHMA
jgi:hypothetical protein